MTHRLPGGQRPREWSMQRLRQIFDTMGNNDESGMTSIHISGRLGSRFWYRARCRTNSSRSGQCADNIRLAQNRKYALCDSVTSSRRTSAEVQGKFCEYLELTAGIQPLRDAYQIHHEPYYLLARFWAFKRLHLRQSTWRMEVIVIIDLLDTEQLV